MKGPSKEDTEEATQRQWRIHGTGTPYYQLRKEGMKKSNILQLRGQENRRKKSKQANAKQIVHVGINQQL